MTESVAAEFPALPPPIPAAAPTKDERTWGLIAHVSQFVTFVGVPGFLGPLVVYFLKSESPFVRRHAKQSLWFNVGLWVIGAAAGIFAFLTCGLGVVVALPVALVLAVLGIIYPIVAGIRANEGGEYRYPITGSLAD